MLGRLRPYLIPILERVAAPIARSGISPNKVSFAAIPLAVVAAYALATEQWISGFVFALAAALVDLLDGAVARLQGRKTLFGNYFETMMDRWVEAILYVGLSFSFPRTAAFALATAMLVSYAKARVSLVIMTDNHDWPALGERAERMTLLLTGIFFQAAGFLVLQWTLAAIGGMCALGTIQRMFYAHDLIERAESEDRVLPYLREPAPVDKTGAP
ncbi:MAG: hypothetical protein FJX76_20050 [Armatimonadetes bacterium]|nr:hypothetical protein [Armatimonadota bacterium]